MPDTQIVNLDTGAVCALRYTGPERTFKLATDLIIAAAMSPMDPVIEDFLEVACAIFFADSSFPRGSETRPEMGAGCLCRNLRRSIRSRLATCRGVEHMVQVVRR